MDGPEPAVDALELVAARDVAVIRASAADWLRRGGVGAFMGAAIAWDALEASLAAPRTYIGGGGIPVSAAAWDIFAALHENPDVTLNQIRDLRQALFRIEAYALARGWFKMESTRERVSRETEGGGRENLRSTPPVDLEGPVSGGTEPVLPPLPATPLPREVDTTGHLMMPPAYAAMYTPGSGGWVIKPEFEAYTT
jgi:hypothetical protein